MSLGAIWTRTYSAGQALLQAGELVAQGLREAFAELGEVGVELGQLFLSGRGVQRDVPRSAILFGEACDKGSVDGCSRLATMLESGDMIGRDLQKARELYKRGCDAGVVQDCYSLARQFQRPETRDVAQASKYNKQACDAGIGPACYEVGLLYESGTTVPRDPVKALTFYQQACAAKHEAACERAKRLKR